MYIEDFLKSFKLSTESGGADDYIDIRLILNSVPRAIDDNNVFRCE